MATGVVAAVPPHAEDLRVYGELIEDSRLRVAYRYVGGHEGNTVLKWIRHDDIGGEIVIGSGAQYVVQEKDIGRLLVVECIPVRSDGAYGQVQRLPPLGPVNYGAHIALPISVTHNTSAVKPTIRIVSVRGRFTEGGRLVIDLVSHFLCFSLG
jgi:hypothetical protein